MEKLIYPILVLMIPFYELISDLSHQMSLDSVLVSSQVKAESSFDPRARSRVGAIGLMQIMPSTAVWLGFLESENDEDELYNPQLNLKIGTYYDNWLRKYWAKRKWSGIWLDLLMVASYNAGAGRVRRCLASSGGDFRQCFERLPQETQTYTRRIMLFRIKYLFEAAQALAKEVNW